MAPCFGILSALQGKVDRRVIIWMDEDTAVPERTRQAGVHDLQLWGLYFPNSSWPIPGPPGNLDIPSLRLKADTQARAEGRRQ